MAGLHYIHDWIDRAFVYSVRTTKPALFSTFNYYSFHKRLQTIEYWEAIPNTSGTKWKAIDGVRYGFGKFHGLLTINSPIDRCSNEFESTKHAKDKRTKRIWNQSEILVCIGKLQLSVKKITQNMNHFYNFRVERWLYKQRWFILIYRYRTK